MAHNAPARWDLDVHRRLAHGEAAALGESYDRFASLVHGLAYRVLADDSGADQVTREVFGRLWTHPDAYHPERGPLRSWLAELAHRLAVARLRSTSAAALAAAAEDAESDAESVTGAGTGTGGGAGTRGRDGTGGGGTGELERTVRRASAAARADYLVTSMPGALRAALELAYFQRRDCRQIAGDLGITEDEAHHRLRLGLQLLATAHGTGPLDPPLGYHTAPDRTGTSSAPHQRYGPWAAGLRCGVGPEERPGSGRTT